MRLFSKETLAMLLAGTLIMSAWNSWAGPEDDRAAMSKTVETVPVSSDWSFAPATGTLQADLQKGEWSSAFSSWQIGVAGSAFAESPNGKALYSYILSKNGMPTIALENLFDVKSPSSIHPRIKKLLAAEFPSENAIWTYADYLWKSEWSGVFGADLEFRRATIENKSVKTESQFKKLELLASKTQKGSIEWARIQWLLGTSRAVQDKPSLSYKHFNALLSTNQSAIGRDQIMMGLARVQFQEKKFQAALQSYSQVAKNSDYWLEALEEKAWTHIRLNDYKKALGELETVLTPVFAAELGPEPYLVSSFSNLKICDFQGVFKIHEQFKERYRQRAIELDLLAKTGRSSSTDAAVAKLISGVSRWAQLGPDAERLPRFIHRDQAMDRYVRRQRSLLGEQARLSALVSEAKSEFASSRMESAMASAQNRLSREIQKNSDRITKQMKKLAQNDLNEVSRIIRKLHIVEAEAIQRMHLYDKLAAEKADPDLEEKISSGDVLVFPHQGEIWLDELDHYQVNAKGCPPVKKGS
jgi:hypothetical protein